MLRGDVVPVEEPAHEDGGGDGLDLFAERGEGEAVDALQDAALAPLDFVGASSAGLGCSKTPRMARPCISMASMAW